jgi:hypothetical protein
MERIGTETEYVDLKNKILRTWIFKIFVFEMQKNGLIPVNRVTTDNGQIK